MTTLAQVTLTIVITLSWVTHIGYKSMYVIFIQITKRSYGMLMCQCTYSLYIKDRDCLLTGFWTIHYRVLVSLYLVLDTSKLMSDVAS